MRRFAVLLVLALTSLSTGAHSQNVDCQGIMNQLLSGMGGPGNYSGGAENLADIYNRYCQGGQPAPQQSQEVGDYCSNGGTCPPGTQCSSLPGRCFPSGNVDCGHYNCSPGSYCGSGNTCLAQGSDDCGGGRSCKPGSTCSRRGNMCLSEGSVDCGSYSCNAGSKCAKTGNTCLAADAVDCGSYQCQAGSKCGSGSKCLGQADVDCGGGKSCPAGNICLKGGAECLTRQQLADRVQQEKQQKADEERRKQEAKRLAKEEEARKQEEKKRLEREAQEAASRAKAAADAEKAANVAREKKLSAESTEKARLIAADTNQSPAARAIANIALGNTPKPNEASNRASNKFEVTAKERDLAIHVARQSSSSSKKTSGGSTDEDLRVTMNDRTQSPEVRKLAAIALGIDPDKVDTGKSTGAPKTALTAAQLDFLKKNIVEIAPPPATPTNGPGDLRSPGNQPYVQSTFRGPVEIGTKTSTPSPSTNSPADAKKSDPFHPTQQEKDAADAKRKADEERAREQAAREKPTRDVETSEVCGRTFVSLGSCAPGNGLIPDGKWCHHCTRERQCKLVYGLRHCSSWSEKKCNSDVCQSRAYRPMTTQTTTMPMVSLQ